MNKKLKRNLLLNITYQILILFLPLVTSSYLSRIIGAEGIGKYSYYYSIAQYFIYFTMLGLSKYGNRIIASVQTQKEKMSRQFCEIYKMQIICFLISSIFYVLYVDLLAEDKIIACIQMIYVLSALFDINWFFFGMEMFEKTVIRNIIIKLLTTFSIFLFVKTSEDVYKYTFIMSLGYLLSQIALWPYLPKLVKPTKVSMEDVKKHIKPNFMMFLPVIAVSVYKVMDKIMLGMMSDNTQVGFYENAEKIINVPIAIFTAFGTVMLPRVTAMLSENKGKEVSVFRDKTMVIITAFSAVTCFGLMSISQDLSLVVFGSGFETTATVIQLLAVTIIFLGTGNVIRTQHLIPYKYDNIYIKSAFLGAVINLIGNIILIPNYAALGASISTIMAEAVVCFYQFIKIRKGIPLFIYYADMLIFSVFGFCMYLIVKCVPDMNNIILSLIIQILIGASVFGFLTGLYYLLVIKRRFKYAKNIDSNVGL